MSDTNENTRGLYYTPGFLLGVLDTLRGYGVVPEGAPRPPCEWCAGSGEGQTWDAEARRMVTVPGGCPRCGKAGAQD